MNTVFWFRRDLRLFNNHALYQAIDNGCKDAIFFITEQQWQRHGVASIQIDLLKRRLNFLGQLLADNGITLHIIEAGNYAGCVQQLSEFCQRHSVTQLFANKEYEINEVERDNAFLHHTDELKVSVTLFDGDVVAPPGTVLNQSGEMFKVFTPFKNAWLKQYQDTHFYFQAPPTMFSPIPWQGSALLTGDDSSHKWPVDDASLSQICARFISDKLLSYKDQRDIPSIKGTSGLSPYLALGIVSVEQLIALVQQQYVDVLSSSKSNLFTWVNELVWREFYRHLIVAYPKLNKYNNFNEKYDPVKWRPDEADFTAWCEGKTGYPLVDAAMRQLIQTGWMHNRLRMVVASFLTKHLLIDWRKGERFFMQHLIDGDLASNNGGWQWAASTGCDAQPYFRIFNPITQSERFDPDGDFIRKYIPELENVPNKQIHFPHEYLAKSGKAKAVYWPAIVDHKTARLRALDAFKV
ncbi:deoxyribodipyrimidine photo-lyase [Pseudoalteromonas sp. SR44-5]|uniref:deoxyribodipyrimidine photo-lyase n=1 Tax=Pseudoalteromonas sp. SR44-5 TaxID=2760934 RepID=UPI0015FF8EC9|nr:deoxyribodipyrimidine photo-lyase [Pseudoalteromonas sp. SR44-5]MBB1367483.1 deoxyribodipyrimidine photo-lyase [Pseudoalteromonas sp. SR44-5]